MCYHIIVLCFILVKLTYCSLRAVPRTEADVLKKAKKERERITALIATRVAHELTPFNGPKYKRAYSPCLQEYIEASMLLNFMDNGALLSRDEIQSGINSACETANVPPLALDINNYILGAADIAGELNRMVIAAAGRGDLKTAVKVRDFLLAFRPLLYAVPFKRNDYRALTDLDSKRRTLSASIAKVEKACFDLTVRRAEFPNPPSTVGTVHSREEELSELPNKRQRSS